MTGVPVRRIRFWADEGLIPVFGRTQGGYRLFSSGDLARLELIRSLRHAGLGLDAIREALARRGTVLEILQQRLVEIETSIEAQRRVAAAIRLALKSGDPSPDALRRIRMMTDAARTEQRAAVIRFVENVAEGETLDPRWKAWMEHMCVPRLPDEPGAEQLEAWLEISEMMRDPGFIEKARRNARDSVIGLDADLFNRAMESILPRARDAIDKGLTPDSPVGQAIADDFIEGWARATDGELNDASFARLRRKHLEHEPAMRRYWSLVRLLKGMPDSDEPQKPEWLWTSEASRIRFARGR